MSEEKSLHESYKAGWITGARELPMLPVFGDNAVNKAAFEVGWKAGSKARVEALKIEAVMLDLKIENVI